MKLSAIIISLLLSLTLGAKDFEVRSPEGGLAMKLTLPEGFEAESDSCPMVILMLSKKTRETIGHAVSFFKAVLQ